MAKKTNGKTVGAKIVSRLKGFVDAVEGGKNPTERFTCRTVRLKLEPQAYDGALVRRTRALLGASQAIFAQFLGVSASAVQDWEQDSKPPNRVACRLMDEIRRHPDYWLKRLQELSEPVTA
jgi:putative transcriptional regulator